MTLRHFGWLAPAFAALSLCGLPAPLFAQAPGAITTPQGAVHLTPAQQASYNARLQKFNADVSALKTDTKLTTAQKQAKFTVLTKALDTDMLSLLTPVQRTLVMQQRAKSAAFAKAHSGEIGQGKTLADKLNKSLTPAQNARIAKIGQDANMQLQQINADTTLSPAVKAVKRKAITDAGQAQMMTVLSPAQQAEVKQMQALQKKLRAEAGTPTAP